MPTIDVYNLQKEVVDKLELDENVFNGDIRYHLMKAYVEWQLAKRRSGNAHTKTRGEVSGGGRKPWRQKGTGRARHGSIRSPIWRGGGVVFGPRKRDWSFKLNKKERKLALKSALNYKLKNNLIYVIDKFDLPQIKTKQVVEFMKRFEIESALIVDSENRNLMLSSRNIVNVKYLEDKGLNVFDILKRDYLVISKDSLIKVQGALS